MTRLRVDGPAGAPVVVLSTALGTTAELWDAQLPALREFRVARYDHPPRDSVASLASDLLSALAAAGIDRFSLCGVSLGGMVEMQLASDAPGQVERLVLVATAARFGEPADWNAKAALVRRRGMEAVADDALEKWFTPRFEHREPFRATQLACAPEDYALGPRGDRRVRLPRPALRCQGADARTRRSVRRGYAARGCTRHCGPDSKCGPRGRRRRCASPEREQPEVVNAALVRHLHALD